MFGWLLSRFWNRRKDRNRQALQLEVQAGVEGGRVVALVSEDLSDRGIRLRSNGTPLSSLLGSGHDVPLEIHIEDDLPPVKVKARLAWSTMTRQGSSVSGWQFMNFHGNARRRLRHYLDRTASGETEWEDDAEASI